MSARPAAAVARVELSEVSDPARTEHAWGVIEVYLKDGRQFSLLAATPSWFDAERRRLSLRFYYGAPVLFLRRVSLDAARRAVKAMHAEDEQLLVRYDTPRRRLPELLAGFSGR